MIRAATVGYVVGVTLTLAAFIPGVRGLEPWQREWISPLRRA